MKETNERKRKTRGGRKAPLPEDRTMEDSTAEPTVDSANANKDADLPEEWIAIAAYYIWKNDGQPEGRDTEYWKRAKAELMQLQRDGNLPTGPNRLDEER